MSTIPSDEEILAVDYHFGDPHAAYDLHSHSLDSKRLSWVSIVCKYKSREKIQCMRKDCGTPHNEGAVVQVRLNDSPNSKPVLISIGHCCAEQIFGDAYLFAKASYDSDLKRKRLIHLKRDWLSRETEIFAWFDAERSVFAECDAFREKIDALMPDLPGHFTYAAKVNGGRMLVYREGRKSKFADAMRAAGSRVKIEQGYDVLHIAKGARFFERCNLVVRLDKCRARLISLFDQLRVDNLPVAEMQKLSDDVNHIGEQLDGMCEQVKDMKPALSADNLQGFVRWHRKHDFDSPYTFSNGELVREASEGLPRFALRAIASITPLRGSCPLRKAA